MSCIQQNYAQCYVRQVFLVKISVIVLHGYPNSARPTAPFPFFHCSVCHLINHLGHCICMQYVAVWVYLINMFVASFLCRLSSFLSSVRETDRQRNSHFELRGDPKPNNFTKTIKQFSRSLLFGL